MSKELQSKTFSIHEYFFVEELFWLTLYFEHFRYVRTTYPHIMPLVWEDMFRTLSLSELFDSGISQWVEPVVWNYHPNILMHINSDVWSMYAHSFKNIWIASAFKGATGPDQLLTNFSMYHRPDTIGLIIDYTSNTVSH